MIEEPSSDKSASLEKLLVDNPSDFRFHAAYLAYSDAYDKTTSPEIKRQLNQNITALLHNQIDYLTFYKNINQYRAEANLQQFSGRAFVKTQRKREWRSKMQKRERNKRHKK